MNTLRSLLSNASIGHKMALRSATHLAHCIGQPGCCMCRTFIPHHQTTIPFPCFLYYILHTSMLWILSTLARNPSFTIPTCNTVAMVTGCSTSPLSSWHAKKFLAHVVFPMPFNNAGSVTFIRARDTYSFFRSCILMLRCNATLSYVLPLPHFVNLAFFPY